MTDRNKVHYLFVIDRSGSMSNIATDMTGGIKTFIDKQLEGVNPDDRTVSFYQFDTEHDELYDFTPLADVKKYVLYPRGGTALLDALGTAITRVGGKLRDMPEDERPGEVMVVIVTDGGENSSHEYTRSQVKDLIQHQTDDYNWKFTYLGANQDSFAEAGSIGIPAYATMDYSATTRGTAGGWVAAAASVSMGTTSTTSTVNYSQAQRDSAK
jgi:uncharacterized protein YegL